MPKKRSSNPNWNRKATDEETRTYLIRATTRLSRHLTNHLAGDFAASDDVAALLRTLCGDDDLIGRAITQLGLTDPAIFMTKPPELTKGTHLTVGRFPTFETYEQPEYREHTPPVATTLTQWLKSPGAYFTEKSANSAQTSQKARTWANMLSGISNTWGSHASRWIPPWIEQSQLVGVEGLDLATYVIETAAIVVEDSLRHLLHEMGAGDMAPAPRALPVRPLHIGWLQAKLEADGTFEFSVLGGPHGGTPDGAYPLAQMEHGDHLVLFTVTRIAGVTRMDYHQLRREKDSSPNPPRGEA